MQRAVPVPGLFAGVLASVVSLWRQWSGPHRLLVLLAVVVACGSPTEPRYQRKVGFIDGGGEADPLIGPANVQAGVPFTVTVSTFGSSCLRADGVTLTVNDSVVVITAYDRAPSEPPPCLPDWRAFPRAVTVTLTTPGTAVIRLQGEGFQGTMTVEKTLTVAP